MANTGFSIAKGPGMKTIIIPETEQSPRPYLPSSQDKPTYHRLNAIHEGRPDMEVRKRAASLDESCRLMETDHPAPRTLVNHTFTTGQVNEQQAQELRQYINSLPEDQQYLRDEALLLLEAGNHTI